MKINNFFIIIFIICSCATFNQKQIEKKGPNFNSNFNIYHQYWNFSTDSIKLFLHIDIPLKKFVFKKSDDYFYCDLLFNINISDNKTNMQVYRESWDKQTKFQYYKDTRNSSNYISVDRTIKLSPGEYNIFLNIKDKDSQRSWKINKEYKLDPINILGPILPFTNNTNNEKEFAVNIIEKTDTVWLKAQVYFQDTIDNQINYIIENKNISIDSGKVNISYREKNNLYFIPISIHDLNGGIYKIELDLNGYKQDTEINISFPEKLYWTYDINEIVGVMKYIISSKNEYKKLQSIQGPDQWEYINNYWISRDPSPHTEQNELLIQLNDRVRYVNKHFSTHIPGWESDRGRIYIIYGTPQYIDETHRDNTGYIYQKWVYSNGKQFIFIDMGASGNYSLYREIY